jgi:uncharacterized protein YqeY
MKEVRSRKDSATEYKKAGSDDRAKEEELEAEILENYLPAQMSDADIEKKVTEVIEKLGVSNPKQMGQVMGALSKELKGQADLKKVSAIVQQKLKG